MPVRHSPLWLRVVLLLGLLCAAGLTFGRLPYAPLRALGDHLAADGSLNALTPARLAALQRLADVLGMAALLLGAAVFTLRRQSEALLRSLLAGLRAAPRRMRGEVLALSAAMRRPHNPHTGYFLLALSVLGAGLRFLWLDAPMQYDESYTAIAFAMRPLAALMGDYHLPNNHIFHSVLVHFSIGFFGLHPWSVRLPVYLAGISLIPLGYLTARALYGRPVALLSAALIAVSQPLITYAANARGYTLIAAFTLLGLLLAAQILRHDSLIAWLGLALTGMAGAWTVPVMLYPYSTTLAWLLLGWLWGDAGRPRRRAFPMLLAGCALLTLVGALLLYLPVLLRSGPDALLGNRWVSPLSWQAFWEDLPARLYHTWQEWHAGLPGWMAWLSSACVGLALATGKSVRRFRAALWPAAVAGILPLLMIQRVAPIAKVWLFAQPLWLMGVAAGCWLAVQKGASLVGQPRPLEIPVRALWLGALLLGGIAIPWQSGLRQATSRGVLDEFPTAADYILSHWQSGDGVEISNSYDAPLWFAFAERGASRNAFPALNAQGDYRRLWHVNVQGERPPGEDAVPVLSLPHVQIYLRTSP
ncbi:MAG: hypothetical protein Fur0018_03200 [Anaerolineales bacterium]